MFEEQYRKMNRDIAPSEALNDETFALMKEAQDHYAPPPAPKPKLKAVVLASAATAMAAMLIGAVLLGFWLNKGPGTGEEDIVGNLDELIENQDPAPENPPASPPEADEETPDAENTPGDNAGTSSPDGENTAPPPADDDDEEEPPPAEKPGQTEPTTPEEPGGASPGDPRDPDIINDDTTVTYPSIGEFLTALAQKTAPGYSKNYYTARDLIIVPTILPEQARFRHMHLNQKNGDYSYSYLFPAGGKEYFLDIEVNAPALKVNEVASQIGGIAGEKIIIAHSDNQIIYTFFRERGNSAVATVTLTEVNSIIALEEEQVKTLLAQFDLGRYKIDNALINMTY